MNAVDWHAWAAVLNLAAIMLWAWMYLRAWRIIRDYDAKLAVLAEIVRDLVRRSPEATS